MFYNINTKELEGFVGAILFLLLVTKEENGWCFLFYVVINCKNVFIITGLV